MPYTNPDTMMEIANILNDFDEESLLDIFKSQIIDDNDSYTSLPVNQFQPLYLSYVNAKSIQNVDEDDILELDHRFQNICIGIIELISAKFGIEIDDEWISAHFNQLPAITVALYQFFVLDIFYIFLEVLNNYIVKNMDELVNTFSDSVQGKDSSTIANLNKLDPKYAVLASSMYDVTDYIFTLIDTEDLFKYLDSSYVPGMLIQKLYDEYVASGDLVSKFADIYKEDLGLRSKIVFELIYRIKKIGSLSYNGITNREIEIDVDTMAKTIELSQVEPEVENKSNKTIDDDDDGES